MKIFFTLAIIAMLFCTASQGQNTFAPAGSEWYHSMSTGFYHDVYAGDTIIAGITCRKVNCTSEVAYGSDIHSTDRGSLYFYNTADTVFVYNTIFSRFTPLYVFNVNAGDTLYLPALPPSPGFIYFDGGDSTFRVVIDSVKDVLYDTTILKTVYTRDMSLTYSAVNYSYGIGYAAKIGGLSTGFFPSCYSCTYITEEGAPVGNVRCYNDSGTSIKLTPGVCDFPPTSVDRLSAAQVKLTTYPLPANDLLHLSFSVNVTGSIQLLDLAGRSINEQNVNHINVADVDVNYIPSGLYLIKASLDNATFYKKVTVAH